MKGLMIKDIMCLKKQLMVFCYVIIGVLIVSVMFVLSARFGNLSVAARQMAAENNMSVLDVNNLATLALLTFMFLPFAAVGDVLFVFEEDNKAGFAKVAGALPLSVPKRVLSRYLSVFALLAIGALLDMVIAFTLSFLTDILSFAGFVGIILSALSMMIIYCSLTIVFRVAMPGAGKGQYAQILSLLTMAAGFILIRFQKIKELIAQVKSENNNMGPERLWDLLTAMKEKAWIFALIAITVMLVSYAVSVTIAQRKRGVI